MEDVGDGEADEQIDDGVDEALAELFEVLHQAHAGEFGAVGDGGAGAIDEISHGEWPRLRRGLGSGLGLGSVGGWS